MTECSYFTYNTPIGKLTIASNGDSITHVSYGVVCYTGEYKATALTNEAANQLQEYFAGKRRYFDLPLAPSGTEFQKKVWAETADIPYGHTKTYGQIAIAIGSPKAFRAVGMAENRNPIAIFIPCHRVLGSSGKLVGYAHGLEMKRNLLDLERRHT